MSQLPLPLSLHQVSRYILDPALAVFPRRMDDVRARVMLLAIGLQESRFKYRRQIMGPARGLWQFEKWGGVQGVLSHPASRDFAVMVCKAAGIRPNRDDVYQRLEHDDILAARISRLLLWTDPRSLPQVGDVEGAWSYYMRNWRPGRPHPASWPPLYQQALGAV